MVAKFKRTECAQVASAESWAATSRLAARWLAVRCNALRSFHAMPVPFYSISLFY